MVVWQHQHIGHQMVGIEARQCERPTVRIKLCRRQTRVTHSDSCHGGPGLFDVISKGRSVRVEALWVSILYVMCMIATLMNPVLRMS